MEKNYDEELNQEFIKEIINEYYENPNDKTGFAVIGHLAFRAFEGGKVPMAMMNVTTIVLDANPDVEIEDVFDGVPEPEERFVGLTNDNGNWLPLFTDRSELDGLDKTNEIKEVPIIEILAAALADPDLEGVVINPGSDHFPVSREVLEWMFSEEVMDKFEEFFSEGPEDEAG